MLIRITLLLVILSQATFAGSPGDNPREVNTFSIVAYDPATGEVEHMALMRPPCQDGVIAAAV